MIIYNCRLFSGLMQVHHFREDEGGENDAVPLFAAVVMAFRLCGDREGSRTEIFVATGSGNLLKYVLIFLICIQKFTRAFQHRDAVPLDSCGDGVSFL